MPTATVRLTMQLMRQNSESVLKEPTSSAIQTLKLAVLVKRTPVKYVTLVIGPVTAVSHAR